MNPGSVEQLFFEAFRHHPTGISVLTANDSSGPIAMTVGSLISVSAHPPVVAFSLSAKSPSAARFLNAKTIVVHLLRYRERELARLGATPGADRFGADVRWRWLPTGEPHYLDVHTWFRAKIIQTLSLPGATLAAAELLEGHCGDDIGITASQPLIYLDRRWHHLHEEAGLSFSVQEVANGSAEYIWY